MTCTHAVIPRLGLGNSLFPWARAEVFRARHQLPMLAPVWFKPALGPLLRREADKRWYWQLFRDTGYVTGAARLRAWWTMPVVAEPANWFAAPAGAPPARGLIVFRGLRPPGSDADYFLPLQGHAARLRDRLVEISRPGTLAPLPPPGAPFIGVHLRCGDLAPSLTNPAHPAHSPRWWFLEALRHLQATAELRGLPVRIMTDGTAADREPFAALPGVEFVDAGNAVANLLYLSRAVLFLGTGYSTFSRWISFLGGMPTLYFPGYVPPALGHAAYSGAFDPAAGLAAEIRAQVAWRCAQPDAAPGANRP